MMNFHTKDEAAQKWCPMARVISDGNSKYDNRGPGSITDQSSYKCIASECMFWIWKTTADGHHVLKMVSETGDVAKDFGPVGHCGLVRE